MLTFTGVPPGSGNRLGLDRDLDLILDGDEAAYRYGNETNGCSGPPLLRANDEPRLGNAGYGMVAEGGPVAAGGFFVFGLISGSTTVAGVELLVAPAAATTWFVVADAFGEVFVPFAIPAAPQFVGLPLFAQIGWVDPCGPLGFSASRGLGFAIVP